LASWALVLAPVSVLLVLPLALALALAPARECKTADAARRHRSWDRNSAADARGPRH